MKAQWMCCCRRIVRKQFNGGTKLITPRFLCFWHHEKKSVSSTRFRYAPRIPLSSLNVMMRRIFIFEVFTNITNMERGRILVTKSKSYNNLRFLFVIENYFVQIAESRGKRSLYRSFAIAPSGKIVLPTLVSATITTIYNHQFS